MHTRKGGYYQLDSGNEHQSKHSQSMWSSEAEPWELVGIGRWTGWSRGQRQREEGLSLEQGLDGTGVGREQSSPFPSTLSHTPSMAQESTGGAAQTKKNSTWMWIAFSCIRSTTPAHLRTTWVWWSCQRAQDWMTLWCLSVYLSIPPGKVPVLVRVTVLVMKHLDLGRKGFSCLTLLYHCSSPKEVRTGAQARAGI